MNVPLPFFLIGCCLAACTSTESKPQFPECSNCGSLETLYYLADTVIKRNDSVLVVNSRLDTTVVETGIFTYLQYSFPVNTPAELVRLNRQGILADKAGDQSTAVNCYQAAINFYQNDWLQRKSGFENGGFSDANDYFAANVNVTLLVSHAYDRLGRLTEARTVLAPFLANVEADNSRIQLRYVELCRRQYGREATRQALEASSQTLHRLPDQSPESDQWRVTVFGAALGLPVFTSDTLSPTRVRAIIRKQPFYALVK
ncbi:hypothetical protein LJY25_16695 [Hymenobacter sp. BT175]|uniref:hypothetical protein n=1 Tax=Hymenobacter translucens TaxID=2886507 RepID=UPI001D0DDB71|nr:hypothetical protein [Hymenobacter translucens]MCC2548090.1 hypothetical protein [Hymenobacter translucens]